MKKRKLRVNKRKDYVIEKVVDKKTGRSKYVVMSGGKAAKRVKKKKKKTLHKAYDLSRDADKFMKKSTADNGGDSNAAVMAASDIEHRAEQGIAYGRRYHRNKPYRKYKRQRKQAKKHNLAEKREEKIIIKKEIELRYNQFLKENPKLNEANIKNEFQKRAQKNRIKREYAKALRKEKSSKAAKEAVETGQKATVAMAMRVQEFIRKHASLFVSIGVLLVLILLLMGMLSSCSAIFSEGLSGLVSSSYTSVPVEIDGADLRLTELEMQLQNDIDSIEQTYPDCDEYRYNVGAIGHDPFTLISYLSAVHGEFTAAGVESEVDALFDSMYNLSTRAVTETRTRTETRTGTRTYTRTDGTRGRETYTYEVEVEYEVSILEVTLSVTPLETVVSGLMDSDQQALYEGYSASKGMLQYFYSPLDLYWYNYIRQYEMTSAL